VCEINKEIEIAHGAISFLFGIDPGEMGLSTYVYISIINILTY
jgi:hypothetical protein